MRGKPLKAQKTQNGFIGFGFFVALVAFLLPLLAACAKVGVPQPPFIRIPEEVKDLSASQSGYNIVLTWTDPARNIDLSPATDLGRFQIRSGGVSVATVDALGAGKTQSYPIPFSAGSNSVRNFEVIAETKKGKTSKISNTVSITPVDVPGKVSNIRAVVDQRHTVLTWSKPDEHPDLADAYIVTRTDRPAEPASVTDTRYEDPIYQQGKMVTYQITPLRRIGDRSIPGIGAESMPVLIEDKTPPQVPAGFEIVESDNTIHLTWEANSETDLAGYRVFRSTGADGPFTLVSNGVIKNNYFADPDSKPGMYYSVSALDEFGNESARSPGFRGPL